MIRLSKKTDYGIVLMAHFARHPERTFHNARQMAEETRLPSPIVSQLLKALARGGLLLSHRGTKGGYELARDPERISVADVIRALEGPIGIMECTTGLFGLCRHEPDCSVRSHWQLINRAFLEAMGNLTLAEMALPPRIFGSRYRVSPSVSSGAAAALAARPRPGERS